MRNLTISNILSYSDVTSAYDAAPWGLDWGQIHTPYKWKVTTSNGDVTIGFERYETVSTEPLIMTFFRTVTELRGSHTETRYREVRYPQQTGIMGIPQAVGIQSTGWWNSAWQYRIDNQIPDGARPYQLSLNISNSNGTNNATHVFLNGKANNNLSDIRFTLNNENELSYWIENISTGRVWVNVIDNGTVYIYYGNHAAIDSSNGTSTFEFFDDFTSDFAANPVMSPELAGWESTGYLRWGSIAYLNGTYYMYYTNGASNTSAIGRATSTDLITWDRNPNNPIIPGKIGPSLLKELNGTTPVVFNGKYWMLTMESNGSAIELRSATTLDNDTWTLVNSSLLPRVSNTWHSNKLFTTSFVKDGNDYSIIIEALNGTGNASSQYWNIGYFNSLSPEGPYIDRGVLLSPAFAWEGKGVLDPEMRKFDGKYYIFYTGGETTPYQNSYANSSSMGGNYVKSNINLTPVNQSYPAIMQKDLFYYILTDDQPSPANPGKSLYRRKDLNGPFGSPFNWNKGGNPTVSGSELLINATGEFVRSSSNFLYKAMKIKAKYASAGNSATIQYFGFVPSSAAAEKPSEMFFRSGTNSSNVKLEAISGNSTNGSENTSVSNPAYFGSYHNYEILWKEGEAKFIIDGALKATQTTSVADTSLPIGIYNYHTAEDLIVDWVFVRNYVSNEPVWAGWSIQTPQSEIAPGITDFGPKSSVVNDTEGTTRSFNITVNQFVNVTWYINGTSKQTNLSEMSAIYTNTSAAIGIWNVTAIANNTNGSVSQKWIWNVTAAPTNGTNLTSSELTKTIASGRNATYTLSLRNTGSMTDNYTIAVNNPNNARYGLNVTSPVKLFAGATQIFTLNVTNTLTGVFRVNITANSTNEPSKKDYINTTTTVVDILDEQPPVITISYPINKSNISIFDRVIIGNITDDSALTANLYVNSSLKNTTWTSKGIFRLMNNLTQGFWNITISSKDQYNNYNQTSTFVTVLPPVFTKFVNVGAGNTTTLTAHANTGADIELSAGNFAVVGTVIINASINASDFNATNIANGLDRYVDINATNLTGNLTSVKLTMFYNDSDLDKNLNGATTDVGDLDENSLTLYWYWDNITGNPWLPLTANVDYSGKLNKAGRSGPIVSNVVRNTTENYITVTMNHFSIYTIAGTVIPTPGCTSNCGGGSSGSSSGGGGGGGGASGENYNNIDVVEKYDMQISKDALTSYRFTSAKNPIMFVNITGNTSLGLITTSIEVLKNTSSLVKVLPEGLVYKNANIWVGTSGFATPKNIKDAFIKFRIDNAWMTANSVSASDVVLMKWDGKAWINLETKVLSKDDTNSYLEGRTNSFSPFAIVAKKAAAAPQPTVTTPTPAGTPVITATATPVPTKKVPGFGIVLALLGLMAVVLRKRSS